METASISIMTDRCIGALRPLILAIVLCCSRAPMAQESTSAARESEREEIIAILQAWEEAWNTHDMRAFANLFHEDGVWVLWTGQVWAGRQAIEEGHAEVHRTIFRNSVQRERVEELRFVGPDAAVVRFCRS